MNSIKIFPSIQLLGQVSAVVAFVSLRLLLDDNLGMVNEVDVLPLAKQFADPNWIPNDWYLNQSPGYRRLFATLVGQMIVTWGFLATSIIGRLVCYSLIALGLVLIGRCLGLQFPLLLTAVGVFLYANPDQGVAAQEWLIRALETKSIAYGLVLLAIFCLLRQRYLPMALLLGFATSFHVLVGGWTTLIILGHLLLKHRGQPFSRRRAGLLGFSYLLTSAFAIPSILSHLLSREVSDELIPSFIYVFLRLPHHLNPASWQPFWWLRLAGCLLILGLSMKVLQQHRKAQLIDRYHAQLDLLQLTLISLVPFGVGLAITPFDDQGYWLQYYPFRVGDVLLPLHTCLLSACAVQCAIVQPQVIRLVCLSLVAITCSLQWATFQSQLAALDQFPQRDPEFIALCNWIKTQTPADAVIISPPVELVEFSWLTERATIAKYKLLPQSKTRILEWYGRLADLNGGTFPQPATARTQDARDTIRQALSEGYQRLRGQQVRSLMKKYAAQYFLATRDQALKLPIAYRNSRYILYEANTQQATPHSEPVAGHS